MMQQPISIRNLATLVSHERRGYYTTTGSLEDNTQPAKRRQSTCEQGNKKDFYMALGNVNVAILFC